MGNLLKNPIRIRKEILTNNTIIDDIKDRVHMKQTCSMESRTEREREEIIWLRPARASERGGVGMDGLGIKKETTVARIWQIIGGLVGFLCVWETFVPAALPDLLLELE